MGITETANDSSHRTAPKNVEIFALSLAAVSVVVIAILSYRDAIAFGRFSEQLNISQRIVIGTTELLSTIKDAENGQRGFLLTRRESYLGPYDRAISEAPRILNDLTSLTTSRPDQAKRVAAMKTLVREKLDELRNTIEVLTVQGADAARAEVMSDRGAIVMDRIRQLSGEIDTVAQGRLVRQTEEARSAANRTRVVILVGSAMIFGLLVSATVTVQRGTRRRQHLIETLRDRERALGDSQQLLQAVIQNSTAVIYVKELTGRYALVNRRFEELFDVTQAQMTERTNYDVFSKEQADAFCALDLLVTTSGETVETEETILVKGGPRTYLSIKFPIFDASGKAYAVGGIATDITERKRAEATRALLAAVVEFSDDAIISETLDGIVTSWNAGAEKIFGYSAREMTGQPVSLLIPLEARGEEADLLARIQRGDLVDHYEATRLRNDGTPIHVSLTVSPLRDADGKIFGASKVARDISERRRLGLRLQAQVERLSLLDQITRAVGERQDLRSIFQVVVGSLEDRLPIDFGCVCAYNSRTESLTVTCVGTRSEALATQLGMSEHAHIHIDQNGLARCVRGELIYEPDIRQVDFPFARRLAAGGLCSVVIAPLLSESKVFGVLVTARRGPNAFTSGDCEFLRQLSGHVALAAHQAQLYAALQHAYDDLRRTQQSVIQQERLRALGQMASGIAHDINNALSPVTLYTEAMLEREPNLSARSREYLEITRRALDDVAHTVGRLQEFYRQRETQLALLPVDLNHMVQQVLDLTRARWNDMPQQRGVVIQARIELTQDPPKIAGIESEIREALVNLVFNAVDAMPDGGILTLRTRTSRGGGARSAEWPHVNVEVTDTGQGMDEETRRRCLEPFFTTKGERGTGMGLAMVFGVMRRHNAEIEIVSTPGVGTTMLLSFPVPAARAAESEPATEHAIPSRLRILVVDDDPLILKSLRDTLESDGHLVVTANGGEEGIKIFQATDRNAHFAVVITDLGMPRVDGRRVASAVKAWRHSTPVILLTGWGQRLMAEGDVPAQVDRVLSKPPKLRELRAALAELVVERPR